MATADTSFLYDYFTWEMWILSTDTLLFSILMFVITFGERRWQVGKHLSLTQFLSFESKLTVPMLPTGLAADAKTSPQESQRSVPGPYPPWEGPDRHCQLPLCSTLKPHHRLIMREEVNAYGVSSRELGDQKASGKRTILIS